MSDNEYRFCSICRHELPVLNNGDGRDNEVEKILMGRVALDCGTALLRFEKKGIVQQLLHNLKYRGYKEIGSVLGSWLGKNIADDERFRDIDAVIPVPLHASKLRKRGFNQVDLFGRRIAENIQAEYIDDVLLKTISTPTKVFQKRFSRWKGDQTVFSLRNAERLQNMKILIVDDIITTGATIEACAEVLKTIPGLKIGVATMAIAD